MTSLIFTTILVPATVRRTMSRIYITFPSYSSKSSLTKLALTTRHGLIGQGQKINAVKPHTEKGQGGAGTALEVPVLRRLYIQATGISPGKRHAMSITGADLYGK